MPFSNGQQSKYLKAQKYFGFIRRVVVAAKFFLLLPTFILLLYIFCVETKRILLTRKDIKNKVSDNLKKFIYIFSC